MNRQKLMKREFVKGLLLLVALMMLLSFAGKSDIENRLATDKEVALFRVEK